MPWVGIYQSLEEVALAVLGTFVGELFTFSAPFIANMVHECCMSAFSVLQEEECSGHLRSTSLSLPFVWQV